MIISELCQAFFRDREKRFAQATVRFYRGRLKKFIAAFGPREFASLTLFEVMQYLEAAGEGLSDSTRRHNIVSLSSLQAFALKQGLLEKPVFKDIEKPPMGQRDRLPTAEETEKLLADAPPAFALIYAALRQSGARPGELCRATIGDLDPARIVITLAEHKTARKTGKPRRIPVGDRLRKLIEEAIGTRTDPKQPIFLSPSGRGWRVENLSRTYTRLRKAAGLPDGLCLYLARHECGTAVCKEKGLEVTRRILGHTNPKTTIRYVHYDDRELADLQDAVDMDAPKKDIRKKTDDGSSDTAAKAA